MRTPGKYVFHRFMRYPPLDPLGSVNIAQVVEAFGTMDLEEARISLGSYADELRLRCDLHSLAVDLAKKEKTAGSLQQRARALIDQSVGELRRLEKETIILCILLDEEIAQRADRYVRLPHEFAKVLEAKNRVTPLLQQVGTLLQDHDHREAVKNEPPKEGEVAAAVRRYYESVRKGIQSVESISESRSEDT